MKIINVLQLNNTPGTLLCILDSMRATIVVVGKSKMDRDHCNGDHTLLMNLSRYLPITKEISCHVNIFYCLGEIILTIMLTYFLPTC